MEVSCVAAAAAQVGGIVTQAAALLYGCWDEADTPLVERLISALSQLRTILQEVEKAALQVPDIPVALDHLPRILEETSELVQELYSQLLGSDNAALAAPAAAAGAANNAMNSVALTWRRYDPQRKMRLNLTEAEVDASLSDLQLCVTKLQKSISRVPELSSNQETLQPTSPAAQASYVLWAQRADYADAHANARAKRVPGTSEWILSHPEYVRWARSDRADNILYCRGESGSGKTIIASAIIDELRRVCDGSTKSDTGLAYFYFSYKVPSSILGVALALLEQLLMQSPRRTPEMMKLGKLAAGAAPATSVASASCLTEDSGDAKGNVGLGDVIPLLLSLFGRFRKAYIVIDALDECGSNNIQDLHHLLSSLADSRCHMLVLSRPVKTLSVLCDWSDIEILPDPEDLRLFTQFQIAQHAPAMQDDLKRTIADELSRPGTEPGMFQLVFLHLQDLLGLSSKEEIMKQLNQRKTSLSEVYEQEVERIRDQPDPRMARVALQTLTWLSRIRKQLTADELSDIVTFDEASTSSSRSSSSEKDMGSSAVDIVRACMRLVIHNVSSGTLSLAHLSVKEFLNGRASKNKQPPEGDLEIVKLCLRYLLQPGLEGCISNQANMRERLHRHPFYQHAVTLLGQYAQRCATPSEELKRLAMEFLDDKPSRVQATNQILFRADTGTTEPAAWKVVRSSPLHTIAYFGLDWALEKYLRRHLGLLQDLPSDLDPDQDRYKDEWGRSPLHLAARGGYVSCVNRLLGPRMQPLDRDGCGRTAFHYAAMAPNGNRTLEALKTWNLEHATPNGENSSGGVSFWTMADNEGRLPIDFATRAGQTAAVEFLLEPRPKDGGLLTPALSTALSSGQGDICKILLDAGAEPTAKLLKLAVDSGFETGVRLLLKHGVDVNETTPEGTPPLHAAVMSGKLGILQLLLPYARLEAENREGRTAVACALVQDDVQALRVLARAGARLEVDVVTYKSSLEFAASHRMMEVVKYLLREGLNVKTALAAAEKRGDEAAVQVLNEAGAQPATPVAGPAPAGDDGKQSEQRQKLQQTQVGVGADSGLVEDGGHAEVARTAQKNGAEDSAAVIQFEPPTMQEKETSGEAQLPIERGADVVDSDRSQDDANLQIGSPSAGNLDLMGGGGHDDDHNFQAPSPSQHWMSTSKSPAVASAGLAAWPKTVFGAHFFVLDTPLPTHAVALGTIVLDPANPLAAYAPSARNGETWLRELARKYSTQIETLPYNRLVAQSQSGNGLLARLIPHYKLVAQALSQNGLLPPSKDVELDLSGARVRKETLTSHGLVLEEVAKECPEEIRKMAKSARKAFMVVGLLQLTNGKVHRRDRKHSVAEEASLSVDPVISPSPGGGDVVVPTKRSRGEDTALEAAYEGKSVFAVQYRVVRLRSGIFRSKSSAALKLQGYYN